VREPEKLGRKIVVKPYRKHGNGAKGGGRKGRTGKRGIIYQIELAGQTELARFEKPTFRALSRELFASGLIPRYVSINKSGETLF
jgi:hypothetical protein